ncbi:MAG: FkbM family methyltransferase [Chloroflexi bacterium]|nr:MAG: FkbM family methyltransferase [Chloroflexota bacterium]TMD81990.1 MAG: FkbM family methyltransferase [Chloroflexota bacterium]
MTRIAQFRETLFGWAWQAGVRVFRLSRRVGVAGVLEPVLWKVAARLLPVSDQETLVRLPSGASLVLPPRYRDARTVSAGLFQPELTRLLSSLLRPGMSAVDIGAYVGYFTVIAAQAVGAAGRVYCFEPNPSSYVYLRRNIQLNGFQNVVSAEQAISSQVRTMQLVADPLGPESFVTDLPDPRAAGSVEAVSLDHVFSRLGWPRIHLIRMNIEGSELAALDGMKQTSQRNPELQLIMEFNPRAMVRAGVSRATLSSLLDDLGFRRSQVIEDRLRPISDGVLPAGQAVYNLLLTK